MTDIAGLSFAIDSSQAVTASEQLDRLTRQSGSAQQAMRQLSEGSNDAQKALRDLTTQAQLTDTMLRQTGAGLDGLITKIQTLSREVGAFRSTTQELNTALGQLRAAGDLFGTSATGIDAFVRASRQIGLNNYETVSALQRITQALEATTVAGERARRVLREYGVNTDGRGTDDAAGVLREFVTQLRTRRADALRNDEIFSVLGPQTISSLAAINSDQYQTIEMQRRRQQEAVVSPLTLRVRNSITERDGDLQRQIAERQDLERNFSTFGEDALPWPLGGAPQPSILRQRRASGAIPNSDAFRLEVNPDGTTRRLNGGTGQYVRSLLRSAYGLGSDVRGNAQMADELGAYRGGELYSAMQSDILQRFQQEDESRRDQGWWQRNVLNWSPELNYVGRRFNAFRGQYAPNTTVRQQPNLQRTANWDLDSATLIAQGGMSDPQQALQRMMIPALQGFGNIDVSGFERMSPIEIMNTLSSRDQGWARDALQRRLEALNTTAFQRDGRAYGDRDTVRRITSGVGSSTDLFGIDPSRLGLDTTEVITNQDAAEKAQLIAQAVLRIRQQYTGLEDQARALQAAADDIDRDQRVRTQRREVIANRDLEFTQAQRGRAVDVNPQNRLQNVYDSTRDRALQIDGASEVLANTLALRALTEATINLERSTNEALRNSALGVARATNSANRWLTDEPFTLQQGTTLEAAQAVQEQARNALRRSATNAAVPGVTAPSDGSEPLASSATRYGSVPGRPALGASYARQPENEGPFRRNSETGQWEPNPWHALRGLLPTASGRLADFGGGQAGSRPAGGGTPGGGQRDLIPRSEQGFVIDGEVNIVGAMPTGSAAVLDPRADVRTGRLGTIINPVGRGLDFARERLYGSRSFEFDATAQVDRMLAGGQILAGNEDRFMSDARSEARRQYLERFDQALLRTIESYEQQTETLRASTPLERSLNEARQRQARELTELSARLRGASPEEQSAIRDRMRVLGPEGTGGLYADQARSLAAGQFRQGLVTQQRSLEQEEAISGNWWMTNENRARFTARMRASQGAIDAGLGGTDTERRAMDLAGETARLQEMTRQNQMLRDSFLEMGNASQAALAQIILRGGDARQVLQGLLADMASMFLRRASTGAFEKGFEWLAGNLFGGSSLKADTSATDAWTGTSGNNGSKMASGFGQLLSLFPFAQGGVTDSRGQIMEHPTYFPMAGGAKGLAGEAGGDAILPLTRDASGRLGVAASGSGGGNSVVVNVTNNGAGAATSPDQARQIAKEVQRAMEEQQTSRMLNEQRVGGMFNPI